MKNRFRIDGDVAVIEIRHVDGRVSEALIDIDQIETASAIPGSWGIGGGGYVVSINKQNRFRLAHLLAGQSPNPEFVCDHIDRNPLNNRKSNLRWVPRWVNVANRKYVMKPNRSRIATRREAMEGFFTFLAGEDFNRCSSHKLTPAGFQHTLRALLSAYFTEDRLRELELVEVDETCLMAGIVLDSTSRTRRWTESESEKAAEDAA